VPHHNELAAKYAERGMLFVGVTNEARGLVDKFIESTGARYPILIEGSDTTKQWGVKGFPTIALVGADGRILFEGHGTPPAEVIETALKEVRLLPTLPRKFAGVTKSLEAGKFADARKALERDLAGTTLDEAERKTAEETVKWIDDRARALLDGAKALGSDGRLYDSAEKYERVSEGWKGLPQAAEADAALKELLADPNRKKEIDGGKALADALKRAPSMKAKQAASMFQAIASKFKGTKAGERAAGLASKYEATK
jgi:hypothetical protein